jgi:hypothetical protein
LFLLNPQGKPMRKKHGITRWTPLEGEGETSGADGESEVDDQSGFARQCIHDAQFLVSACPCDRSSWKLSSSGLIWTCLHLQLKS